ncbi:MAG: AAA family ATPase [Candidatus Levybacteria bacterium]|nr:AAA family ATPase [Candidatus Levybacteria bacterium]
MDPAQKATNDSINNPLITPSVPNTNGAVSPPQQPLAVPDQGKSSDQIRKLGEKIEQAPIPEDLREMLLERISRLALLRSSAGFMSANYILEYENTAAYVHWVVRLPWGKSTQDILDLIKAKQILDKNHYGLEVIKTRILEYMATVILNLKNKTLEHIAHAPILCLVGLAGTGKTTLGYSIAEALGKKFERIPFGGMADPRALRGQSRAFPDAEPGLVVKKLIDALARNCVILLDELDRVTDAARGDIMGVLLELLDPGQNKAFTDHYIDYPFDLSNVLFIATANNTTNISTAVLDRLEIIQMPSYTDQEKIVIAKQYLFSRVRQMTGLTEQQLVIADDVWPGIIRPLGFDSGIRSLQRTIEGICRKAARIIVEGKAQSIQLTNANVKDFLPHW